jgi:uncharacterized protein YndB with AHSA1/START domain
VTSNILELPVRKSVVVNASATDAFEIFTDEVDTWWPRSHHIGKSPMKRIIIEPRAGGRCYSEQMDNSECDWGRVLVWEPPRRLVLAWQITHDWGFQPDLAKSSEVEVRFTPIGNGTRVDVEHRHFERHGAGGESMRTSVDAPNGWSLILSMYEKRANERGNGSEHA